MKNDYLLLIDGSSLLSTQFFGSLPRQILFSKTIEEKEKFYDKILQTSDGFYTNGVFGFIKYLLKIIREQKPSHIAIAWEIHSEGKSILTIKGTEVRLWRLFQISLQSVRNW